MTEEVCWEGCRGTLWDRRRGAGVVFVGRSLFDLGHLGAEEGLYFLLPHGDEERGAHFVDCAQL